MIKRIDTLRVNRAIDALVQVVNDASDAHALLADMTLIEARQLPAPLRLKMIAVKTSLAASLEELESAL